MTSLALSAIMPVVAEAKSFSNDEIAQKLREMSACYEILGENPFRVRAYARAADSVEHASSSLKDLWDDGQLNQLSGIGPSIAGHLDELFKNGRVKHFREIKKKIPESVFEFLKITGIGPKTAYKLATKLNIKSKENALKRLQKAAENKKIRPLEGFGEKSESKILVNIKEYRSQSKTQRMLLPIADQLAGKISQYLEQSPAVMAVYPLGSLRRKVSTIGDIDLAVKTKKPSEVIEHFVNYPQTKRILGKGKKTLSRIRLENGRSVDLRTQTPDRFGAMLQYFTGSKHHNIQLREYAQEQGYSLSEYGIKKVNSEGETKEFATEKDFYRFLDMAWIPPELRENRGEIKAAQNDNLPSLVKKEDLRGDCHLHSSFDIEPSHDLGTANMAAMAVQGAEKGYRYLAFSEHNPAQSNHSQEDILDLIKAKKEKIDELNYTIQNQEKDSANNLFKDYPVLKKSEIFLFNSLEIDIKPDGSLAIPAETLEPLDFAIAAIHTSLRMPKKEMTQRVLQGLSHPKVKMLAHPTGRMLNVREGYELNWEKIFKFCRENNKILEINSFYARLDLPDYLVKQAIESEVLLSINTDSHCLEHMDLIDYGLAVARRGWAEKDNIVNTFSLAKFKQVVLNE